MAFKRDGDDACVLRNLQHRRVGDLLSNHIPDEEAKLLSNGRLTCLVCSRRPIFDTISILSVHRKGKKHLIELSKYLAAKRELEQLKEKHDHKIMTSTGSLPASDTTLGKGFLLSAHTSQYVSCAKRFSKEKVQLRRTTLNVGRAGNQSLDMTKVVTSMSSASSDVQKYLKEIKKKRDLKQTLEECRLNCTLQPSAQPLKLKGSSDFDTPKCKPVPRVTSTADEATKRQAEMEMKYKMAGWLQDCSGTWKKNPDAEFDSDEEEPEIH